MRDNGSGVAATLEVACVLSMYETEYTVKYIAFDLEEHGFVGSHAYANEHQDDDIRGVLALDMIAHDAATYKCRIYGRPESNPIKYLVAEAVEEYAPGLNYMIIGEDGYPPDLSDNAPFEDVGFQACLLIENMHGTNPCYHQPCDSVDTPDYIHYPFALEYARTAAGFLADQAVAQYPFDCDSDGIPDADEIQENPSLDCNGNGLLDTCEHQGFEDGNANGIADACDCLGDLDGDGATDHADLGALLGAWDSQPGDPHWNADADLDGNGHIGHADLGILLGDWGCGT